MQDLNVLALFKGAEKFIFVYDDASRAELLNAFRDSAANPDVAINWFDAAVLKDRAEDQFEANDQLACSNQEPGEQDLGESMEKPARF